MESGIYDLSECDVAQDFASLVASCLFCPVYGVNVIQWAGAERSQAAASADRGGALRAQQTVLSPHQLCRSLLSLDIGSTQ